MLRGPAEVMGHGIFIAPATTSDPGNALASRHSTTREVRLCQCCDFAAQGPQTGPYAVTLSLLKVNSPYQLVNNCKRAGHGSGFMEHGHLLSCREFWGLWRRNNMSFVQAHPDSLAAAAGTLQGIGSALSAQNAAAAAPTTGVVPAAADEVSALTAAQFAAHASDVPGGQRTGHSDPRGVCEARCRPAPALTQRLRPLTQSPPADRLGHRRLRTPHTEVGSGPAALG